MKKIYIVRRTRKQPNPSGGKVVNEVKLCTSSNHIYALKKFAKYAQSAGDAYDLVLISKEAN